MTNSKEKPDLKTKVRALFDDFLLEKQYRKTPERYAVLDIVYSSGSRHFEIEWLCQEMEKQAFRVSRATVYNTMQLLVECHLAIKHQFRKKASVYERALYNDPHHHLICTQCGKIIEHKDPDLIQLIGAKSIRRFTPSYYDLNIYGICSTCTRMNRKKRK
ncbi:MAG: transcriptional repressor [Dysgonamonadaceae bacterium]|jgi:Fur family ferric uptake transcriptional regulator|nr:transcriptional repressor [Dysgonamonadaceae bacterium]